jgi:glycosyltransferase involved in cell wall biosynthesis
MAPSADRASVIIPVQNQEELTRLCLQSIATQTDVPYELIVIDNGSTQAAADTLRACRSQFPNIPIDIIPIDIIHNDTNLGFAKACNQGLARAEGQPSSPGRHQPGMQLLAVDRPHEIGPVP